MPYSSRKPMQIRKGTVGYVVKIKNKNKDTIWPVKTYSSILNVIQAIKHTHYTNGDRWYVYDASTLALTHVSFIRYWAISQTMDVVLMPIDKNRDEDAAYYREKAGKYNEGQVDE